MMTVLVHTFTVHHRALRVAGGEVTTTSWKARTAAQVARAFTAANPDRKIVKIERADP
jgi:hypothetical protein